MCVSTHTQGAEESGHSVSFIVVVLVLVVGLGLSMGTEDEDEHDWERGGMALTAMVWNLDLRWRRAVATPKKSPGRAINRESQSGYE